MANCKLGSPQRVYKGSAAVLEARGPSNKTHYVVVGQMEVHRPATAATSPHQRRGWPRAHCHYQYASLLLVYNLLAHANSSLSLSSLITQHQTPNNKTSKATCDAYNAITPICASTSKIWALALFPRHQGSVPSTACDHHNNAVLGGAYAQQTRSQQQQHDWACTQSFSKLALDSWCWASHHGLWCRPPFSNAKQAHLTVPICMPFFISFYQPFPYCN